MGFTARTFGWTRLRRWLDSLPARTEWIAEDLLEAHANWLSRKLQRHISSQDLGWVANAPMTVSRKGHGIVMVETKGYFGSFGVHDQTMSRGMKTARVGPGSGKTQRTRIPYTQIGNWLEFGTKNQPARPLFRPTLTEWKSGFPRVLLPIAKKRLY